MNEVRKGETSLAPKNAAQAWRRRGAALGMAGALGAGLTFAAIETVDTLNHYDDPIPAGCQVPMPKDGTAWGIASQIAEHTSEDTGQVMFDMSRANPDVTSWGQVDPGQPVGIPAEYCPIVDKYDIGQ